jgi:hypothetical protein
MTETVLPALERPRRLHFDWLLPALIRPRAAFDKIAHTVGGAWLTPMLLVLLFAIVGALLWGNITAATNANQPFIPPPGFENFPPEEQQRIMDQWQATQQQLNNPLVLYVFPAVAALAGVFITWLLLASVLHLVLTLFGGRSAMRNTMNVVAWTFLPIAVRYAVQCVFMLSTQSAVPGLGLSGFAPEGNAFVKALLAFVDVYLLWQIVMLVIGSRAVSGVSTGKVSAAVVVSVGIVLGLQALPAFIGSLLLGLNTQTF